MRCGQIRKYFGIISIFLSASLALGGCGSKEQVVFEDTQEPEIQADSEDDLEKKMDVEDYFNEQIQTVSGDKINVCAAVSVPDAEKMNVYETRKKRFSDEEKESLLKYFSDDDVVYSAEDGDLPKYVLQESINYSDSVLQYYQSIDVSEDDGGLQELIDGQMGENKRLHQEYENAGTDWKQVEDYSGEQFMIYYNGIEYALSFQKNYVVFQPISMLDLFPELEDYRQINSVYASGDGSVDDEEKVGVTAEAYASEFSVGEYKAVDIQPQYWSGIDNAGNENGFLNGYEVTLYRCLDGTLLEGKDYYSYYMYSGESNDSQDFDVDNIYLTEYMQINILEDGGLARMILWYPVEYPEVKAEGVSLLSYDTIKTIILDELENNPPVSYWAYTEDADGNITYRVASQYQKMGLYYLQIPNPEDENVFSIVPVWYLTAQRNGSYAVDGVLAINAIDGSVVDFAEE